MALGLRYIREVLKKQNENRNQIELKEYTINQQTDTILADIYKGQYDLILMSVYIWNVEQTWMLIRELKKINPQIKIAVGGPEVTYSAYETLEHVKEIDFIFLGEGEETVSKWFECFENDGDFEKIQGLGYRKDNQIYINEDRVLMQNLDMVPFPYDETDEFENRLVYYESSRGCPYNCSYCISSTIKGVRFFSLDRVKRDLKWLVDKEVKIVKFVDRTFNIKKEHFLGIMKYLKEIDNGLTGFHFEITASLLDEETLEFLSTVREGQFQFEIGVQSTHGKTLKSINRFHDLEKLKTNVAILKKSHNIHLHLDLIAGLPYEGYHRFLESFNEVYLMKPDVIQLGFLKLLKGSELRQKKEELGYIYRDYPPYEVLQTDCLTFSELDRLKKIEDLLDKFFNSGKFKRSIEYLETAFIEPRLLYEWLAEKWEMNHYFDQPTTFHNLYLRLFDLAKKIHGVQILKLANCIKMDILEQRLMKVELVIPEFHSPLPKAERYELLKNQEFIDRYLKHYTGVPAKKIIKQVHFELFTDEDGIQKCVLFDYINATQKTIMKDFDVQDYI